jgi:beta-lactamase regulating signal transducer with metallopeptidase domain
MIAILADAFVKSTMILVIAAIATSMLRRSPASLRHLVWTLACAGVLALPLASALLPNWRVAGWPRLAVPAAFEVNGTPAREASADLPPRPRISKPAPPAAAVIERSSTTAAGPVQWQITLSWTALLVPVWLGGVAVVLMLLAVGLARIAWLDRVNEPVSDEAWLLLVDELSLELGLTRRVRLLRADGPAMPMTWGIRRPAILLPADADTWSLERRRDVLLHELAHVKRHDFLTQLIARCACAVYWFHPLAWLAAGRLRVERERACDDQVLRAGVQPSVYAADLLEIARGLRAARATTLASVAMARPSQLATRLLDVLDPRRRRETLSTRAALPAWVVAGAIVFPLAAIAPRGAETAGVSRSIDTIPRIPAPRVVSRRAARPQMIATTRAELDSLRGCAEDENSSHRSSSVHVQNDRQSILTTVGRCTVSLSADGPFTFNADFTDVATVQGDVVIDVDYGAHDRRVRYRNDGGRIERVYKVDGEVKPFDNEARAWLAETLTFLVRRTGFMAEERARWILEKRGVQGLLEEAAALGSDYARRTYYQAAVASGQLDVAGYERVVADAGRTITSDYELAELLIAVAKAQPLTAQMQAGFVTAAKSIQSDFERHRVLKAALAGPGLTPSTESAMLSAATDIKSDFELATLLLELNEARPIDESVRPAFFQAANAIGSDYEHRRVLAAVVTRAAMTPAMVADVLQSAKTIHSDYELAELLLDVIRHVKVDDAIRAAIRADADSIGSQYERGRVFEALERSVGRAELR